MVFMKPGISSNASLLEYEIEHKSLLLSNSLILPELNKHYQSILNLIKKYERNSIKIDLTRLVELDSAGVAFINELSNILKKRKISVELVGANEKITQILNTFAVPEISQPDLHRKEGIFERSGRIVYNFFSQTLHDFLYLSADLFYWTFLDLFKKKTHRKGEFINQAVNIGVNAVPIVGLISFLIGLVLALQSAAQLRQFGANVFIVDLVVIAMTAEMGPLLTAIMIAGRSGSAIASETATMTVTEEVDALKTMGLNPIRYIVIPKMHASIFTLPFLTIFADILGILGGMVIANFYLDISIPVFINRMISVLFFKDIFTGFIKSLVFASLIVLTGAFFGFRVKGGSEGVGKYTTKAVVTSIFLVILADSILGLLFY